VFTGAGPHYTGHEHGYWVPSLNINNTAARSVTRDEDGLAFSFTIYRPAVLTLLQQKFSAEVH